MAKAKKDDDKKRTKKTGGEARAQKAARSSARTATGDGVGRAPRRRAKVGQAGADGNAEKAPRKTTRKTASSTAVTRTRKAGIARRSARQAPPETVVSSDSGVERRPPTHEEVAWRAYEIYLGRHGQPGDPVADWLQAEAELRG